MASSFRDQFAYIQDLAMGTQNQYSSLPMASPHHGPHPHDGGDVFMFGQQATQNAITRSSMHSQQSMHSQHNMHHQQGGASRSKNSMSHQNYLQQQGYVPSGNNFQSMSAHDGGRGKMLYGNQIASSPAYNSPMTPHQQSFTYPVQSPSPVGPYPQVPATSDTYTQNLYSSYGGGPMVNHGQPIRRYGYGGYNMAPGAQLPPSMNSPPPLQRAPMISSNNTNGLPGLESMNFNSSPLATSQQRFPSPSLVASSLSKTMSPVSTINSMSNASSIVGQTASTNYNPGSINSLFEAGVSTSSIVPSFDDDIIGSYPPVEEKVPLLSQKSPMLTSAPKKMHSSTKSNTSDHPWTSFNPVLPSESNSSPVAGKASSKFLGLTSAPEVDDLDASFLWSQTNSPLADDILMESAAGSIFDAGLIEDDFRSSSEEETGLSNDYVPGARTQSSFVLSEKQLSTDTLNVQLISAWNRDSSKATQSVPSTPINSETVDSNIRSPAAIQIDQSCTSRPDSLLLHSTTDRNSSVTDETCVTVPCEVGRSYEDSDREDKYDTAEVRSGYPSQSVHSEVYLAKLGNGSSHTNGHQTRNETGVVQSSESPYSQNQTLVSSGQQFHMPLAPKNHNGDKRKSPSPHTPLSSTGSNMDVGGFALKSPQSPLISPLLMAVLDHSATGNANALVPDKHLFTNIRTPEGSRHLSAHGKDLLDTQHNKKHSDSQSLVDAMVQSKHATGHKSPRVNSPIGQCQYPIQYSSAPETHTLSISQLKTGKRTAKSKVKSRKPAPGQSNYDQTLHEGEKLASNDHSDLQRLASGEPITSNARSSYSSTAKVEVVSEGRVSAYSLPTTTVSLVASSSSSANSTKVVASSMSNTAIGEVQDTSDHGTSLEPFVLDLGELMDLKEASEKRLRISNPEKRSKPATHVMVSSSDNPTVSSYNMQDCIQGVQVCEAGSIFVSASMFDMLSQVAEKPTNSKSMHSSISPVTGAAVKDDTSVGIRGLQSQASTKSDRQDLSAGILPETSKSFCMGRTEQEAIKPACKDSESLPLPIINSEGCEKIKTSVINIIESGSSLATTVVTDSTRHKIPAAVTISSPVMTTSSVVDSSNMEASESDSRKASPTKASYLQSFRCSECGKVYSSQRHLQKHLQTPHKKKSRPKSNASTTATVKTDAKSQRVLSKELTSVSCAVVSTTSPATTSVNSLTNTVMLSSGMELNKDSAVNSTNSESHVSLLKVDERVRSSETMDSESVFACDSKADVKENGLPENSAHLHRAKEHVPVPVVKDPDQFIDKDLSREVQNGKETKLSDCLALDIRKSSKPLLKNRNMASLQFLENSNSSEDASQAPDREHCYARFEPILEKKKVMVGNVEKILIIKAPVKMHHSPEKTSRPAIGASRKKAKLLDILTGQAAEGNLSKTFPGKKPFGRKGKSVSSPADDPFAFPSTGDMLGGHVSVFKRSKSVNDAPSDKDLKSTSASRKTNQSKKNHLSGKNVPDVPNHAENHVLVDTNDKASSTTTPPVSNSTATNMPATIVVNNKRRLAKDASVFDNKAFSVENDTAFASVFNTDGIPKKKKKKKDGKKKKKKNKRRSSERSCNVTPTTDESSHDASTTDSSIDIPLVSSRPSDAKFDVSIDQDSTLQLLPDCTAEKPVMQIASPVQKLVTDVSTESDGICEPKSAVQHASQKSSIPCSVLDQKSAQSGSSSVLIGTTPELETATKTAITQMSAALHSTMIQKPVLTDSLLSKNPVVIDASANQKPALKEASANQKPALKEASASQNSALKDSSVNQMTCTADNHKEVATSAMGDHDEKILVSTVPLETGLVDLLSNTTKEHTFQSPRSTRSLARKLLKTSDAVTSTEKLLTNALAPILSQQVEEKNKIGITEEESKPAANHREKEGSITEAGITQPVSKKRIKTSNKVVNSAAKKLSDNKKPSSAGSSFNDFPTDLPAVDSTVKTSGLVGVSEALPPTPASVVKSVSAVASVRKSRRAASADKSSNNLAASVADVKPESYVTPAPSVDQTKPSLPLPVSEVAKPVSSPAPVDKPFKCRQCNAKFSKETDLSKHSDLHKVRTYDCYRCVEKFTTMRALTKHLLVHQDEPYTSSSKLFACSTCASKFESQSLLDDHVKCHDVDQTKYECNACSAKYSSADALASHFAACHMQKKESHALQSAVLVSCTRCASSFKSTKAARAHMIGKHGMSRKAAALACGSLVKKNGTITSSTKDQSLVPNAKNEQQVIIEVENSTDKNVDAMKQIHELTISEGLPSPKKGVQSSKRKMAASSQSIVKAKAVVQRSKETKRKVIVAAGKTERINTRSRTKQTDATTSSPTSQAELISPIVSAAVSTIPDVVTSSVDAKTTVSTIPTPARVVAAVKSRVKANLDASKNKAPSLTANATELMERPSGTVSDCTSKVNAKNAGRRGLHHTVESVFKPGTVQSDPVLEETAIALGNAAVEEMELVGDLSALEALYDRIDHRSALEKVFDRVQASLATEHPKVTKTLQDAKPAEVAVPISSSPSPSTKYSRKLRKASADLDVESNAAKKQKVNLNKNDAKLNSASNKQPNAADDFSHQLHEEELPLSSLVKKTSTAKSAANRPVANCINSRAEKVVKAARVLVRSRRESAIGKSTGANASESANNKSVKVKVQVKMADASMGTSPPPDQTSSDNMNSGADSNTNVQLRATKKKKDFKLATPVTSVSPEMPKNNKRRRKQFYVYADELVQEQPTERTESPTVDTSPNITHDEDIEADFQVSIEEDFVPPEFTVIPSSLMFDQCFDPCHMSAEVEDNTFCSEDDLIGCLQILSATDSPPNSIPSPAAINDAVVEKFYEVRNMNDSMQIHSSPTDIVDNDKVKFRTSYHSLDVNHDVSECVSEIVEAVSRKEVMEISTCDEISSLLNMMVAAVSDCIPFSHEKCENTSDVNDEQTVRSEVLNNPRLPFSETPSTSLLGSVCGNSGHAGSLVGGGTSVESVFAASAGEQTPQIDHIGTLHRIASSDNVVENDGGITVPSGIEINRQLHDDEVVVELMSWLLQECESSSNSRVVQSNTDFLRIASQDVCKSSFLSSRQKVPEFCTGDVVQTNGQVIVEDVLDYLLECVCSLVDSDNHPCSSEVVRTDVVTCSRLPPSIVACKAETNSRMPSVTVSSARSSPTSHSVSSPNATNDVAPSTRNRYQTRSRTKKPISADLRSPTSKHPGQNIPASKRGWSKPTILSSTVRSSSRPRRPTTEIWPLSHSSLITDFKVERDDPGYDAAAASTTTNADIVSKMMTKDVEVCHVGDTEDHSENDVFLVLPKNNPRTSTHLYPVPNSPLISPRPPLLFPKSTVFVRAPSTGRVTITSPKLLPRLANIASPQLTINTVSSPLGIMKSPSNVIGSSTAWFVIPSANKPAPHPSIAPGTSIPSKRLYSCDKNIDSPVIKKLALSLPDLSVAQALASTSTNIACGSDSSKQISALIVVSSPSSVRADSSSSLYRKQHLQGMPSHGTSNSTIMRNAPIRMPLCLKNVKSSVSQNSIVLNCILTPSPNAVVSSYLTTASTSNISSFVLATASSLSGSSIPATCHTVSSFSSKTITTLSSSESFLTNTASESPRRLSVGIQTDVNITEGSHSSIAGAPGFHGNEKHGYESPSSTKHDVVMETTNGEVDQSCSVTHPFTCIECPSSFAKYSVYMAHSLTHAKLPSLSCNICGNTLPTKAKLKRHMKFHKSKTRSQCPRCLIRFSNDDEFVDHQAASACYFRCGKCDVSFDKEIKFLSHVKTEHPKPVICTFCSAEFPSRKELLSHQISHQIASKCSSCKQQFSSKKALERHRAFSHACRNVERSTNSCDVCGLAFLKTAYLNIHKRKKHLGRRSFQCSTCGKCFVKKSALHGHLKQHRLSAGMSEN